MFYVCDGRRHLLRPGKYGGPKRWRGRRAAKMAARGRGGARLGRNGVVCASGSGLGRRAGREGPAPLHARANGRAAGPVEGAAPRRTTRRALTGPWRRADARRSPAVPRGLSGPRPARLRSARPPRTRSVSPKPFPERAAHSPAQLPRGHAGPGRRRCGAGLGWHVGRSCAGSAAVGTCHPRCQRAPRLIDLERELGEGRATAFQWPLRVVNFVF